MVLKLNDTYNSSLKIIWLILSFFLLNACHKSDDINTIEKTISVNEFSEIIVYNGVKVNIKKSDSPHVQILADEERINEVSIEVIDQKLHIKGEKTGLFATTYSPIDVTVYTPELTQIRHSGNHLIYSDEVLDFPVLILISENHNSDFTSVGDFNLKINNDFLMIASNGNSNFKIDGQTKSLELNYYSGTGIFDGQTLVAESVSVFHRGVNTLKVYPLNSLKGHLYSTGNLEVYNHPEIVDVTEHYTGRLIYKD